MTWLRTEAEVDALIAEMVNRSKGKYITQGVAFNKTCPRQMEILKQSLMTSVSFSGLAKEVLAVKFSGQTAQIPSNMPISEPKKKNIGNFI